MGLSAINGASFIEQQKLDQNAYIKRNTETAGTLAFGGAETAGSMANNVGGSFCAFA
jgi:hypothetical protein